MSEPWLTKLEIAAALKVSPRTVVRLRLPFTRVGGQNRYQLSECEQELRARQAGVFDIGNSANVVAFPRRGSFASATNPVEEPA